MGHQKRDVISSLTQRRQMQLDYIQSVKQISSKSTCGGQFLKITIAGRDLTRVHLDHFGPADRHNFSFLQYAQTLHLQSATRLTYHVVKNVDLARMFEVTELVTDRAG